MRLKNIFESAVEKVRLMGRVIGVKRSNKANFQLLQKNNISIKRLSFSQKKQVDALFKKQYHCRYSYATHELYLSVTGDFKPDIIPEDLFRIQIEPKMNDTLYKKVLSNKALFEKFLPKVTFPKTIIRNMDGLFYDNNYNLIFTDEAEKILNKYTEVVFKPTLESGGGKSVRLVDLQKENPLRTNCKNYVLQERIIQHNDLEKLNESSVNVVRIMTWFNGSEVIPINAELHVGGKGLFTDNQSTEDGLGMTCTGLTLDGKCKGITVHPCGVRTNKSASGFTLDGYQIPNFNRMIKIAKEQHTQLPKIDFIGWDFTVDINGEVVVIEYNIKCPGVLCQQYVNGPLFGEYRTEILDKYLKKK